MIKKRRQLAKRSFFANIIRTIFAPRYPSPELVQSLREFKVAMRESQRRQEEQIRKLQTQSK